MARPPSPSPPPGHLSQAKTSDDSYTSPIPKLNVRFPNSHPTIGSDASRVRKPDVKPGPVPRPPTRGPCRSARGTPRHRLLLSLLLPGDAARRRQRPCGPGCPRISQPLRPPSDVPLVPESDSNARSLHFVAPAAPELPDLASPNSRLVSHLPAAALLASPLPRKQAGHSGLSALLP